MEAAYQETGGGAMNEEMIRRAAAILEREFGQD